MPDTVDRELPAHVRVAIVGAGFAGLGMAIRLAQEEMRDFVVLERADDVGGTWRDNSYPGATCDVPSLLYSFSFAPSPDWSRSFSPQPEILDYLRLCVDDHGVRSHILLGNDVRQARWEDATACWRITTSRGELRADVLIGGMGPLSEPRIPDIPGLADFRGDGLPLGPMAPRPRPGRRARGRGRDRRLGGAVRSRDPATGRLTARVPADTRVGRPSPRPPPQRRRAVGVPAAARRPAGRPALQQPNVEVIASGLAEVRPRSVVADDGTEREVDTIVFGTGFRVTDYPAGDRIVSADRTSLSDAFSWRFWQRTRRFEPRDYVRRPRLAPVPVAREPDVV